MVTTTAGAAGIHPSTTLSAPYAGTVSSPSSYLSASGCSLAKTLSPERWSGSAGVYSVSLISKSVTCAKSLGGVGVYSSSYLQGGIQLAIPFRVASNGNHTIQSSWTFTLATKESITQGGCPGPSVAYPPPKNAYVSSSCSSNAQWQLSAYSYIVDLNNLSWYFYNGSSLYAANYSYWYNDTYCYNYGTPACSNSSAGHNFSYSSGYQEAGKLASSGASSIAMWDNSTKMLRGHHYVLIFSIYAYLGSSIDAYNVKGHWAASSVASVNMASLGNGARLSSVMIS